MNEPSTEFEICRALDAVQVLDEAWQLFLNNNFKRRKKRSTQEDLSEQYVAMKIVLRARDHSIAAKSQGLYKGEEFNPCDSIGFE